MIKLRQIAIRCSALMLFSFVVTLGSAQAQERTVTGKVSSSSSGDAIPGVSVFIKGSTSGSVTNIDGEYSVTVNSDEDILVYSFVGMNSQEIVVGSRSVIDVSLADDVTALEEIVVTGYTSESKKNITGSVDKLDAQKAFQIPATSAAEGFQGRLTGVSVVSNGGPGANPIVRVRGIATTNNNDPLYIIDGFQTNDPSFLNDLNTSDIEEVTVLKDAGAASIYGARATNGVIVITTRKGAYNGGAPKITLDVSYGVQKPTTFPDMLNSQQLGEVFWESMSNDGLSSGDPAFSHPQFGSGASPVLSEYYRGDPSLPYDPATNRLTRTSAGTDWFDELFEDATYQNYYLSINGGNETSKYMMSLGYLDREGILSGTFYERYSARFNSEFSVKDKVRFGQNIGLTYSTQTLGRALTDDESPLALAYRTSPLMPVYDEGGNYAGTYQSSAGISNAQNPVAVLNRGLNNIVKSIRAYGNAYIEVDLADGLTAKSNIGANYQGGVGDSWTGLNPEHSEAVSVNLLGTGRFINSGFVFTNTLQYDKIVTGGHNFSAIIGTEAIRDHNEFTIVQQTDFLLDDDINYRWIGAGAGATTIPNSFSNTSNLFSIFGKVSYNYEGKYLFSATVRKDKTSRFLGSNASGVFPAFSAGWIISEESFIPDAISFLKLRISYGQMGNQSLPVANPVSNSNRVDDEFAFYNFGGNNSVGALLQQPGNANLTWETSIQKNLGVDMQFLDGDLEVNLDFFDLLSKDNLIAPDLPTTAPFAPNNPYKNLGEISNKGLDMNITYQNASSSSDVQYKIGLKVSKYTNEIRKTDEIGAPLVGGQLRDVTFTSSGIGQEVSTFYGRQVTGLDSEGRFTYLDADNSGSIDDADRIALGSPNPDFTFGLNFDVEYQGFDLSLFLNGSQGNEIFNYTKFFTDFPSFYNGNRSTNVFNADAPAPSVSVSNNENQPNSYFIEDGSFVRLKNLQIGYTLPEEISGKAGMSRARIYIQASNLFTITDYSGLDPEIGRFNNNDLDMGIDFGSYPTSQTYLIGFSVDF